MYKFKPNRDQQQALENLICSIENMSANNRAKHYEHFCHLASLAAEHLPTGQTMSVFDHIAALFYKDKSQHNDVYQPGAAAQ